MDKRKLGSLIAIAVTLPAAVTVAMAPAVAAQTTAQDAEQSEQAQSEQTQPAAEQSEQSQPAEQAQSEQSEQSDEAARHDWEFPELSKGSRGDVVKVAQMLLTAQGHPTTADGIFGPKTERSVRSLQADSELPVTGVIDVATWKRLVPTLYKGSRGEGVKALQWVLNEYYGASLVVDGIFGPKTEKAVRDFQKRYDLKVDGIVGVKTWRALVGNMKA